MNYTIVKYSIYSTPFIKSKFLQYTTYSTPFINQYITYRLQYTITVSILTAGITEDEPEPTTLISDPPKPKKELTEQQKLAKKAKADKFRAKKLEKQEQEKEEAEKQRFLALSDREKRALMAERRLLAQCQQEGVAKPVLARCQQCALDITGKTPFEYLNFTFCTTRCLTEHRKMHEKWY